MQRQKRIELLTFIKKRGKQLISIYLLASCFLMFGKTSKEHLANTYSNTYKETQELISGTVTDENNDPVFGVVVYVKGTSNFTETDEEGKYSLTANMKDVLIIQFIGYKEQELVITKNKMNVQLVPDTVIDEVVVFATGFQKISKERSTGAIAQADKQVVADRTTSMNVLDRLEGTVPGLVVTGRGNDGQPTIQIRGQSTNGEFSNTEPLYVIDDVVVNRAIFNTLNPNDLESVNFLKDAVAASIYGSNAANGVVVVTTKRGRKSNKISVDYNTFINYVGKPDIQFDRYLNSKQFIELSAEVFNEDEISNTNRVLRPDEEIRLALAKGELTQTEATALLDDLSEVNLDEKLKNWLYRSAYTINHNLSVRGGGEKYRIFGSLGYVDRVSNTHGSDDETFSITINQDYDLNDNITFSLNTFLNNQITSGQGNLSRLIQNYLPYQSLESPDGSAAVLNNYPVFFPGPLSTGPLSGENNVLSEKNILLFGELSGLDLNQRPLEDIKNINNNNNALTARINASISVDFLKYFNFRTRFGYTRTDNSSRGYRGPNHLFSKHFIARATIRNSTTGQRTYLIPLSSGFLSTTNNLNELWSVRNLLNFDATFNEKHQVTAFIGNEITNGLNKSVTTNNWGYNDQTTAITTLDLEAINELKHFNVDGDISSGFNPLRISPNDISEFINRTVSIFGNAGYTFDKKYTLTGSIRQDESLLFGRDRSAQSRPVWSVGGKWNLHKEDFFTLENVDELAVRLTYGITGNAPSPGTASSFAVFKTPNSLTNFSNSFVSGQERLELATAPNPKLTWESTKNINIGIDYGFFARRIYGSIDLYRKSTSDLIGRIQTNPFAGFSQTLVGNTGSVENKGVEIALNTVNVRTDNFSWNTSIVGSYNKNLVTEAVNIGKNLNTSFVEGFPAGAIFRYDYVGLDAKGDPEIRLNDGTITAHVNDAIQNRDVIYVGTRVPPYSLGIGNTFNYKGLELRVNMISSFGAVFDRSTYKGLLSIPLGGSNFLDTQTVVEILDRWQIRGDEATTNIPRSRIAETTNRNLSYFTDSNYFIESADYLKIRDITLAYNLPETLTSKLGVSNIRIRSQLNNILVWTANDVGYDPDERSELIYNNRNTISFGLNVSF